MDLTPVRIRGKRYLPGQKPSKSKTGTKRSVPVRDRMHALPTKMNPTNFPLKASPKAHLSHLERLPTELLQRIFQQCPNIDLPAASLTLSKKLSSDTLKRYLIEKVFYEVWHKCSPLPAGFTRAYSVYDQGKVQSALLRLRWVTWPAIQKVPNSAAPPKANIPYYPRFAPLLSNQLMTLQRFSYVPTKLLHGPWTDAKSDFLDYLFRSGASIERIDSTDGEIAAEGLVEATREQNVKAVRALLARKTRSREDSEVTYDAGVAPETRHLHVAVLEGGYDDEIVRCLLLEASSSRVDLQDREVWRWVHQGKVSGKREAELLEEVLRVAIRKRDDAVRVSGLVRKKFSDRDASPEQTEGCKEAIAGQKQFMQLMTTS